MFKRALCYENVKSGWNALENKSTADLNDDILLEEKFPQGLQYKAELNQ